MDIFVARQPIFNRMQEVVAYELLYRESEQNFFSGNVASNVATSILLMNSYLNFGIEHLVGHHRAFVNFDKQLIDNDIPQLLNKESVVIELLEDIVPDEAFIEKIKTLKNAGYTVAIDDFIDSYEFLELVELCDIIKVEFMGESRESIEKICRTWKPKGKLLLAEKVETREEYDWAKSIGFDYFQGYFFSKPSMVKSKGIEEDGSKYIRLMGMMNVKEPDFKEISAMIEMDVSLTYKLLKLVNNNFTASKKIGSIHLAVSMLGVKALRKWVSLAMVQNLGSPETTELIITSMVRSHLLEGICNHSDLKPHTDELTLMGILSILNVMLKKPMAELLVDLPITDEIKDTLLGKESPYKAAYDLCLDYERGEFANLESASQSINYDVNLLPKQYIESVKWADHTFAYMYDEL